MPRCIPNPPSERQFKALWRAGFDTSPGFSLISALNTRSFAHIRYVAHQQLRGTARDLKSGHAWRPAAPQSHSPGSEPSEVQFELVIRRPYGLQRVVEPGPSVCFDAETEARLRSPAGPPETWRCSPRRWNPRRRVVLSRAQSSRTSRSRSGRVCGPSRPRRARPMRQQRDLEELHGTQRSREWPPAERSNQTTHSATYLPCPWRRLSGRI